MSLAATRLLARRCPACRRREPGLLLSRGTWEGWPRHCRRLERWREGARQAGQNREALSTVAGLAFGPAHSSGEVSVIGDGAKGPGHPWEVRSSNQEPWEGSSGQTEVAGEAV